MEEKEFSSLGRGREEVKGLEREKGEVKRVEVLRKGGK